MRPAPALAARWHPALAVLHWLTAALILVQYGLSWAMGDETRDLLSRFALYQWHKSFGLTVALLVVLRLALRWLLPAPPAAEINPWQRRASHAVHAALYLCLIALPVTGLLMVAAAPIQIPTLYFGWFQVPHPIGPDQGVYDAMVRLHGQIFDLMAVLLLAHLGAVVLHQFVWRDRLLDRMAIGFRRRGRPAPPALPPGSPRASSPG